MDAKVQTAAGLLPLTFPPRDILLPIDFSEGSLAALEAAKILAKAWDSRLDLLCVDEGPPPALNQGIEGSLEEESVGRYYQSLHHRLEETASSIPRAAGRLVDGDPFQIIPRLAAGRAADLVVMGTAGRRGLERLTSGSVAESTARIADVPVLTARRPPGPGWPARILVPMKWTDYSDQALLAAEQWAGSLGASLTALHVFEGENGGEAEALREHVARLLGEGAAPVEWLWRRGRGFVEILRTAEAGNFDLIVLSAHSGVPWLNALLGTTAQRVLRHAPMPVLSVPAWAPKFDINQQQERSKYGQPPLRLERRRPRRFHQRRAGDERLAAS